jgi:hypothetical protein
MGWPSFTVAELQQAGTILVEDGNHGEYRPRPDEFVKGGRPSSEQLISPMVVFGSRRLVVSTRLR